MSQLTVETQSAGGRAVLNIDGYLSADSAPGLEENFKEVESDKILLVFAEKMFINSAGLVTLFNLIFAAKDQGKEVRIAELQPHFRKMFDIMGLSADVEIFASADEALAGW